MHDRYPNADAPGAACIYLQGPVQLQVHSQPVTMTNKSNLCWLLANVRQAASCTTKLAELMHQ